MKYFRIQTNRATITKFRFSFQAGISLGEQLIAPRPLPRDLPKFYYAIVRVVSDGKNIELVKKYRNIKELTKEEYEAEKQRIEYFWLVGENDA